jgi:putative spermidine/putrescine transport system permease protein
MALPALMTPGMVLVVLPFLAALAVLVGTSLREAQDSPVWPSLATWIRFAGDSFNWGVLGSSIKLAAIVTVLTLLVAYPTASALVRLRNRMLAALAYVVLFSPLFISTVVRSYGWLLLLSDHGLVNSVLGAPPLFLGPYRLIYNETGVIIALVHILLPFAVLPLVSVFWLLPANLRESARDLGASPLQAFLKVTLPLSLPGIVSAGQIVFALAVSAFVTPAVLGGGRVLVLSWLVYDNIGQLDWPMAATQAMVLLAVAVLILAASTALNRSTYSGRRR